jgi:hypothetical protein
MKFNFKKYKQFIIGLTLGSLIFTAIPVGAAVQEFILYKSECKLINSNGEEYSDKDYPVLMYKGRNYVPIGAIAPFLGVDFTWEGKTKTATFNVSQAKIIDTKNLITNSTNSISQTDFNTLNYDGIEYISIVDIANKYNNTYVFTYKKDTNITILSNKDTILLEMPTKIINNLGCINYDYFSNTVLPLLQ